MAPRKRPWFRLYVELIWDRKIRRLTPAHRWLWVSVLACARQSPIPGHLMLSEKQPMSWEDLADAASMKLSDVEKGTDKLHDLGLIEYDQTVEAWFVPKWNDRQFESDETTKRTTKHRSKKQQRNVPSPHDVTPPETEAEDREQKTEAEPLAPQAPRETDHLFEAVANACGVNWRNGMTKTARGSLNAAVKQLRDVDATPTQIFQRAGNYPTWFPDAALTPTALAKHWPQLERAKPPPQPRDRFAEMARSLEHREEVPDVVIDTTARPHGRSLPQG